MRPGNNRSLYVLGWVLGLICCPLMAGGEPEQQSHRFPAITEVTKKAATFELNDQFNKRHAYVFPKDNVTVLLFADYKGHTQLEPWIRALYDRYGEGINLDGVADLSAVPGFLRGIVRNTFRKQLNYPVMLDWQGTVAHRYAYQKGLANLLLIDRQGEIKLRLSGAATNSKLQLVGRYIDALLLLDTPCSTPCNPFSYEDIYE